MARPSEQTDAALTPLEQVLVDALVGALMCELKLAPPCACHAGEADDDPSGAEHAPHDDEHRR